jgi:hypothetical protein
MINKLMLTWFSNYQNHATREDGYIMKMNILRSNQCGALWKNIVWQSRIRKLSVRCKG